jgi:hypothetical protein
LEHPSLRLLGALALVIALEKSPLNLRPLTDCNGLLRDRSVMISRIKHVNREIKR